MAVKVMESEATARRKKSLESEVLARLLGHENVVKVFAVYGVEQRHAIIIMEYVGSWDLHHLLVERREKHLSRDWLLEVAAQVENVSKQLTNLFSFFSGGAGTFTTSLSREGRNI